MPLVDAKCPNCGGGLKIDDSKRNAVCPFCKKSFIIQDVINNNAYLTNNINNNATHIEHLHTDNVNISTVRDFEIRAGALFKYSGESSDVIIPQSVVSIKKGAFDGLYIGTVTLLGAVHIDPDAIHPFQINVPNIAVAYRIFSDCKSYNEDLLDRIYINGYKYQQEYDYYEAELKIPENVETIDKCQIASFLTSLCETQFYDLLLNEKSADVKWMNSDGILVVRHKIHLPKLGKVVLPDSINTIEERAFSDSDLTEIIMPDSVVKIGAYAFQNCSSLKNVRLSQKLETIGVGAFYGCKSLQRIEIPDNVIIFEETLDSNDKTPYEFRYGSNYIKRLGERKYSSYTFAYCEGLKEITLSQRLKKIPARTFLGCTNLPSIRIPASASLGYSFHSCLKDGFGDQDFEYHGPFEKCANLKEIFFEEGYRTINIEALEDCASLSLLCVPDDCNLSVSLITCGVHHDVDYDLIDWQYKQSVLKKCIKTIIASDTWKHKNYKEFNCLSSYSPKEHACYIATAVYGSYDCPEVWTLRRFRDNSLAETLSGRMLIKLYYALSPTVVNMVGNTKWFNRFFRKHLDRFVAVLRERGFEDSPYCDN